MCLFLPVPPSLVQQQQQPLHQLLPLPLVVVEVPPNLSLPLYVPTPCRLLTEDNVNIEVVLIYETRVLWVFVLRLILMLLVWRVLLVLVVVHLL